ncbi:MAG TPA: helix-turn-helix domain-containing protein [Anaeromyxobacteraceae bacterium]|nr:helix-turn-helix domain-containing protein [Anaeromyxobacteraceae bacterium]
MRALLLADSPAPLLRACDLAGAQRVLVPSVAEGRRKLALERFDVVDGRIARPASLELEIRNRLELFYEQLQGHSVSGLYDAVMREVEKPLLSAALARARGVRSDAARDLGIDRGTLARRIRALGLGRRR